MLYQWYMDYTKHGLSTCVVKIIYSLKRIIKYGKGLAKLFLFTRTATFLPSIPPLLTAFLYYDRLL